MEKKYRWASPGEWLAEKINEWDEATLRVECRSLASELDSDQIQTLFQDGMEADGYFVEIVTRDIECINHHEVDEDGETQIVRYATVGMKGKATRQPENDETEGNAWSVLWENGAWGFYSTEELLEDAKFTDEEGRKA